MRRRHAIAIVAAGLMAVPGLSEAELRKPCKELVLFRDGQLAKSYKRQLERRIGKQYRALQSSMRQYARLKAKFERDVERLRGKMTQHHVMSVVNSLTNLVEAAVPASKLKTAMARTSQRIHKELLELYKANKSARTHLKAVRGDVEAIAKIVASALADTYKRDIAKSVFSLKAFRDRLSKMTDEQYDALRALQTTKQAMRDAHHKMVNYQRKMDAIRADHDHWKKTIHRINQIRAAIDSFCHIDPDLLSGTWHARGSDGYTIAIQKGAATPGGARAPFTAKKGRWRLFPDRIKFRNLRYVGWNTWQAEGLNAFRKGGKLGTRWLPSTLTLQKPDVVKVRWKRGAYRLYRRP